MKEGPAGLPRLEVDAGAGGLRRRRLGPERAGGCGGTVLRPTRNADSSVLRMPSSRTLPIAFDDDGVSARHLGDDLRVGHGREGQQEDVAVASRVMTLTSHRTESDRRAGLQPLP